MVRNLDTEGVLAGRRDVQLSRKDPADMSRQAVPGRNGNPALKAAPEAVKLLQFGMKIGKPISEPVCDKVACHRTPGPGWSLIPATIATATGAGAETPPYRVSGLYLMRCG